MSSERGYKMKQRRRLPLSVPVKPPRIRLQSKSTENAYILILGQAGSGKSTTLNFLFGGREISPVERETGTEKVFEFSSKLSSGAELRIIDTPGLGDVNGIEWDSQIISTIDAFRTSHSELDSNIPNVVLIMGRFDDNRIEGELSSFVKMVKSVDLRREKLLHSRHNNLIVVLTHTMNGKKVLRDNPTPRIELVKSLIKTFTNFPHTPIILLAENEADDFDLPRSQNETSFVLPNGEEYPQNIIDAIFQISRDSGDSAGLAIFQEAFDPQTRKALQFKLSKETNLVGEAQSTEVAAQLYKVYLHKRSTEMFEQLAIEWNARGRSCTDSPYQDFLAELEAKNYKDFNQVPQKRHGIIKLLLRFKYDLDLIILMEKVMKLNIPTMMEINYGQNVGFGYYTTTDNFLEISPLEFLNFKSSPALIFKLPEEIIYESLNRSGEPVEFSFFTFLKDRRDYCHARTKQLKLQTEIFSEGVMKSGYNFYPQKRTHLDLTSTEGVNKKKINAKASAPPPGRKGQEPPGRSITMVKEFRLGKLRYEKFRPTHNLDNNFVAAVRHLQPFTRNRVGTKQWRTFFHDYGTHVVKSAFVGGLVEIVLNKSKFCELITAAKLDLNVERDVQKIQAEIFTYFLEPQKRDPNLLTTFEIPLGLISTVKFIGGNTDTITALDVLQMGLVERVNLISEWKASLYERPVVLERELELIKMKEFMKQCSVGVGNVKLERVINSYDAAFDMLFVSLPLQSKNKNNCNLL